MTIVRQTALLNDVQELCAVDLEELCLLFFRHSALFIPVLIFFLIFFLILCYIARSIARSDLLLLVFVFFFVDEEVVNYLHGMLGLLMLQLWHITRSSLTANICSRQIRIRLIKSQHPLLAILTLIILRQSQLQLWLLKIRVVVVRHGWRDAALV